MKILGRYKHADIILQNHYDAVELLYSKFNDEFPNMLTFGQYCAQITFINNRKMLNNG